MALLKSHHIQGLRLVTTDQPWTNNLCCVLSVVPICVAIQFWLEVRFSYVDKLDWLQGNLNLLSEQNVVLLKSAWGQKLVYWHSFFKPSYLYLVHSGGISYDQNDPFMVAQFPFLPGKCKILHSLLDRRNHIKLSLNESVHIHQLY